MPIGEMSDRKRKSMGSNMIWDALRVNNNRLIKKVFVRNMQKEKVGNPNEGVDGIKNI